MSNTCKNLKKRLQAPHTLVEAAKKGEYIHKNNRADTPSRHVRRFSLALAAYACVALLLIGSVSFLPRLLGENAQTATQPSSSSTSQRTLPPDEPTPTPEYSPETLYNALIEAEEASCSLIFDQSPLGEETVHYIRDGSIFSRVTYRDSELGESAYYDTATGIRYDRYSAQSEWVSSTPTAVSWGDWLDMLETDIFEDDCYEKTDNGYRFSDEAVTAYCEANELDGKFEVTVTHEQGIYTFSISLTDDSLQSNRHITYIIELAEQTLSDLDDFAVSELAYSANEDGGYTVIGLGQGSGTHVVIPSTYKGKLVTEIGDGAFANCYDLVSVSIPNSVTRIGTDAFSGCMSLSELTVPDSVRSIGRSAFYYCKSLTSVVIPDGVTKIEATAFADCTSLTDVVIGGNVTSIGEMAFMNCSDLSEIVIPDGVTSIGRGAFRGSGLIRITIPDGVTSIEDNTFWDCTKLREVTLPDGVDSLGIQAFYRCTNLTGIEIPDSVTEIGRSCFEGCSSMVSLTVGNGVTNIGSRAFYGCSKLTGVVLPRAVTTVNSHVFAACDSLRQIFCQADSEPPTWTGKWYDADTATVYWNGDWQFVNGIPIAK